MGTILPGYFTRFKVVRACRAHLPDGTFAIFGAGMPDEPAIESELLWESGAEDARTPDASRPPGVSEPREASGVRPIYRRFSSGAGRPAVHGPHACETSNLEPPSCAGMGHRALPGNDSWTLSAREKCSRLSEGVFCPFWSHLRDTLSIIWDRPNSIRGLFRTIAGVFVESDCGTSFANSKDAVAKGNS